MGQSVRVGRDGAQRHPRLLQRRHVDLRGALPDRSVGIPLDQQGLGYSGYPSFGGGELLADRIDSFQIGNGLFSLLDAFPFQLPDRPDLSVSIPIENRLFGQGLDATFDNFQVGVPEPATWAMMLLGFGAVGAVVRRRRQQPALAAA